ncbi:hypothetical protein J2X47_004667 [Sphingomonas sp. BE270]|jgi:hypothetical protein|uniref:DUF4365 domain-containing protein n=1 Tax=unclassified Sphingomonas TaxID=196159 RepID=UPI000691387C|nr:MULTISPECIES: DUF4365 domain-containing protein [unclassified Sphingomonas]MDR7260458.1 hypothetical protein [Sphingomonas sp. BE270]
MRYDNSSATGDEGETAVELIVKRSLKWIFRRVSGPDVGIDGIVEQVRANEATGRWISLQIKSGDRFFRESGPEGVVFRDERRHLDYYRSHQLPVVVVLHYPGTDDAIWQWVSPETVVETPRGYKVLVPHGQKLDATAATEWAHRLGRRSEKTIPAELQPETRFSDGSLSTIHDVLGRAEHELLVAAPFLSMDFLTLLDFMASKLSVRILTSASTLEQSLLKAIGIEGRLEIRLLEHLHLKSILVDREVACLTTANFTRKRTAAAREVVTILTSRNVIDDMASQFEELWSQAVPLQAHQSFQG